MLEPLRGGCRSRCRATSTTSAWSATGTGPSGPVMVELTMLVSQDDELGAGMLAAYTAEFAADPTVVLVSGAEEFIDEESRPSPSKLWVGHRHNVFVHRDRYVLDHAELVRLSLPQRAGFRRAVGGDVPPLRRSQRSAATTRCSSTPPTSISTSGPRPSGDRSTCRHPYLRGAGTRAGSPARTSASGALARDRVRLYERYRDTPGSPTTIAPRPGPRSRRAPCTTPCAPRAPASGRSPARARQPPPPAGARRLPVHALAPQGDPHPPQPRREVERGVLGA